MRYYIVFAAAALVLAPAVHADLTIHYKTSLEIAPGLPAPMADAMKKQMGTSIPTENTVHVRGDVVVSQYGPLSFILDYGQKQLTLVHPASKRYATLPTSDFSKQIELLLPPQALQAMQNIKVDIQATKSGKTDVVLNVPVEEMILLMSIETPNPAGPPVQMKMELHNWMATTAALERFPEFKQWSARKWAEESGLDPAQIMMAVFAQGPSADKMRAAIQSLTHDTTGLTLRTEMRMFVPFLAQMMQSQGVTLGDGPLLSAILEMDRFNTDPVPPSAFAVPSGYTTAPFVDLMKEFGPQASPPPGPPQAQAQIEPAPERPPPDWAYLSCWRRSHCAEAHQETGPDLYTRRASRSGPGHGSALCGGR